MPRKGSGKAARRDPYQAVYEYEHLLGQLALLGDQLALLGRVRLELGADVQHDLAVQPLEPAREHSCVDRRSVSDRRGATLFLLMSRRRDYPDYLMGRTCEQSDGSYARSGRVRCGWGVPGAHKITFLMIEP